MAPSVFHKWLCSKVYMMAIFSPSHTFQSELSTNALIENNTQFVHKIVVYFLVSGFSLFLCAFPNSMLQLNVDPF